jgi:hypothetical protein
VPRCLCQSLATRSLSHVSNPGRIVACIELSLFSGELQPIDASKNIAVRTPGGPPLDLVLIRTIILGSA